MPRAKNKRSGCPVVFALDVFGDRWTLLIIRDMALRGLSSYGEFLDAGEGISTNILAERLKRLEAAGVITKRPDPDHRGRYRYALSKKGRDLIPVLVQMMRWSAKHDPDTPMSRTSRRRLERDPHAVARQLVERSKA